MPKTDFASLPESKRQEHFVNKASLVGRTIIAVRYMTEEEVEAMGWYSKSPVLHLDDGSIVFPMQDDEGNGAGPLVVQKKNGNEEILPVF